MRECGSTYEHIWRKRIEYLEKCTREERQVIEQKIAQGREKMEGAALPPSPP
jgi:hypothetical protein